MRVRSTANGGEATPGNWLDRMERIGGGRLALSMTGVRRSYVELARDARQLAGRLGECGLEAGDLVAVLAPPSLEGVSLLHALLHRGIVLLPLNPRLTESEQGDALVACGARALVIAGAVEAGEESGAGSPGLALGKRLARAAGCGLLVLGAARSGETALDEPVLASTSRREDRAERRAARRREGAALVLRTSGTSGRPKGASLGFDNLLASAVGSAELLGSDIEDRWLLCMPLFHIGGLSILVRAALVGAAVVMHERFDAERVSQTLDREGITRMSLVATMLGRLLDVRGDRPSPPALELVLLGGGPATDRLLERAEMLGYPVAPTYGLTEAASQVATRPPGRVSADRAGGLCPLPGVTLRVVDDRGDILGPHSEGLIEVKGPIVMRGYLDDAESTSRAIRSGWLATGDIGRLDEEGRLRVLDRRSDLILSGGENVYPAEVESVLAEHPSVSEVGVCGVEDETYGARPRAFVVLAPGATPDADALITFCREGLAGYKCPDAIVFVESLPRTATGKLRRGDLAGEPGEPGEPGPSPG